jgi:hypothetical protein
MTLNSILYQFNFGILRQYITFSLETEYTWTVDAWTLLITSGAAQERNPLALRKVYKMDFGLGRKRLDGDLKEMKVSNFGWTTYYVEEREGAPSLRSKLANRITANLAGFHQSLL